MATTNYTTELQKLYVAYFNRPADPAGLEFWNGVVAANGGNTAVVSADFATQAEYKAAYAGMNSTQIITQVYQNLFSHGPDAAGRDYWVKALDDKIFTIDQIVAEVANGALTTDKTAFNNKVSAATAFTAAVDTAAEKAAYTGDAANAAAKTFIAGITTDASLAAAVTPANLDASVAAVVKAGTAFTVAVGLADLDAANDAIPAFLKTLDLDKDGSFTDTTAADIGTEVTTATGIVAGKVAGYAAAPTAAQKAAILSDFQASLNTTLAADQKTYNDKVADAAKVSGLNAAINAEAAAVANTTSLQKAEAITKAAQAAAEASYESLNNGDDVVINVTTGAAAVGADDVLVVTSGKLGLATGVTEATNPGVTALLAAVSAELLASKSVAAAVAAQQINHLDTAIHDVGANDAAALGDLRDAFTITTPASLTTVTAAEISVELTALNAAVAAGAANAATNLTAFNTAIATFLTANTDPLSTAVNAAALAVTNATKAVTDLDKAVIDLNTATGHAATLKGLEDAVDTATDAFAANGFKAPVTVTGFVGATTGTDIFLASSVAGTNGTILTFGLQGKDVLYVGADHTLNAGALTTGKADVLEVFLIQNGANAEVHVETTTFGSATTDQVVITLAGVATTDLTFSNGIISHV